MKVSCIRGNIYMDIYMEGMIYRGLDMRIERSIRRTEMVSRRTKNNPLPSVND